MCTTYEAVNKRLTYDFRAHLKTIKCFIFTRMRTGDDLWHEYSNLSTDLFTVSPYTRIRVRIRLVSRTSKLKHGMKCAVAVHESGE